MKSKPRFVLLFLSFCSAVGLCRAAPQWVEQTSGATRTLWSVNFVDSLHGWAAGNRGSLVRTTDGGNTWQTSSFTGTDSLQAIVFADPSLGWVAGNNGVIYHSTDSGNTWSPQFTSNDVSFASAWAFNDQEVLFGGNLSFDGVVVRTIDGGTNWLEQSINDPSWVSSFCFVNDSVGWASGRDDVARSSNGGQSWGTAVDPVTDTYGYVNKVWFIDELTGFGVGRYGGIVKTLDGGSTWQLENTITGSWLEDIQFSDSLHGIIPGERGAIVWTDDGGNAWERTYPHHPSSLEAAWFRAVDCIDSTHFWVVGDDGLILKGTFEGAGGIPVPVAWKPGLLRTGIRAWQVGPRRMRIELPQEIPAFSTIRFVRPNGRVVLRAVTAGRHLLEMELAARATGPLVVLVRGNGLSSACRIVLSQ